MFCKNCGNQLADDVKFCSVCGAPVDTTAPTQDPTPVEPIPAEIPVETPVENLDPIPTMPPAAVVGSYPSPVSVLVWGIVALSLACTVWFSFLGIIFGAVGLGKAKKYFLSGAPYSTQVKVGRGLAKGGLIAGIVITAVYAFIFLIAFIAGLASAL